MGIKTYKPYTPARRQMTGSDFAEITKKTPEKSLTEHLPKNAGRNNQGKITVRHHGVIGPAAEGFQAQGSAAGEQVQNAGFGNFALQHIEQVFPDPVQRGPGIHSGRSLDGPSPGCPGDNPHTFIPISSAVPGRDVRRLCGASSLSFPV